MQSLKSNLSLVVALGLGICLGAAAITWSQQGDQRAAAAIESPGDLSQAFRQVARDVLPAVVSIEMHTGGTEGNADDSGGKSPLTPNEEFMRRFFGDDPRLDEFFGQPFDMPQEGRGSGFIVDSAGIVMTNSHVVHGADRVVVHLHDGREVEADSWVNDPRSDVAIIRISVDEPLPTVPLGDSDQMQVGDWVLAMGNPFNVGVTVTAGIISATGRGPGINERESYLQTDAAINPGNSGGPLINLRGEVVGINTAISTSSGGYDGVGFAIPVNMAHWVSDQLISEGRVRRAFLGVGLQPLTNDLRRQFGVEVGRGALVSQVGKDTPAGRAGIEPGDIILEFDGKEIADSSELQGVVERLEIGGEYTAVVQRNGETLEIPVVLEEWPSGDVLAASPNEKEDPGRKEGNQSSSFQQLGLDLEDLTPSVAEQFGLDRDADGVLVSSVQRNSPAGDAGLTAGVVIERVGSTPVSTVEEFARAIEDRSLAEGIVLFVRSGDDTAFFVLKER